MTQQTDSISSIGRIFLLLGCRAFGGPTAHVALFREEFVDKRGWLDDEEYADLMAFTQFLPGPASSQLGMLLGMKRGGLAGLIAAFLGFTLPSAVLLFFAGWGVLNWSGESSAAIIHGLMVAVVAIVTKAIIDMMPKLCPTPRHMIIALGAGAAILLLPPAWSALGQIGVIAAAALIGAAALKSVITVPEAIASPAPWGKRAAMAFGLTGALFGLALIPWQQPMLQLISAMLTTGTLVFGGGHVVLPMLQSAVVENGLINETHFLAGYGLAQAVPGPMFTLATFLGTTANIQPIALTAALTTLALFLPGMILAAGLLPAWERLRSLPQARAPLAGVGAAVLGLLIAAWYNPVFTKAVQNQEDMAMVFLAWALIGPLKLPSWVPVITLGVLAAFIHG